jgi:hypothetical protein
MAVYSSSCRNRQWTVVPLYSTVYSGSRDVCLTSVNGIGIQVRKIGVTLKSAAGLYTFATGMRYLRTYIPTLATVISVIGNTSLTSITGIQITVCFVGKTENEIPIPDIICCSHKIDEVGNESSSI